MLTTYITSEPAIATGSPRGCMFNSEFPLFMKLWVGRAECGRGGRERFDLGGGGGRCTWGRGSLLFLGPDRAVCSPNGQGRLSGGTSFLDGGDGVGASARRGGSVPENKECVLAPRPFSLSLPRARCRTSSRAAPPQIGGPSAPRPPSSLTSSPCTGPSYHIAPGLTRFRAPCHPQSVPINNSCAIRKENTMAPPPHTHIRPAAFYGSAMPPPARDGSTGALGEE